MGQGENEFLGIGDASTGALMSPPSLAAGLNLLVADCFALFVRTKSCGWHVSGSDFQRDQAFFAEHARQLLAAIDALVRRIQMLGGPSLQSVADIERLQRMGDANQAPTLTVLLRDNQQLLEFVREAHGLCEAYGDIASCAVLQAFVIDAESRIWQLIQMVRTE